MQGKKKGVFSIGQVYPGFRARATGAPSVAMQHNAQVTGRSFGEKDFRSGLENGILLCELLNAIKPGLVKKINRLPTPIAGLNSLIPKANAPTKKQIHKTSKEHIRPSWDNTMCSGASSGIFSEGVGCPESVDVSPVSYDECGTVAVVDSTTIAKRMDKEE
ncbi:hypothetical protein BTVI_151683 [Pitangus sulphuratus]|nr:hypothetical protein BTVI_151683 [Pitangus sulphuratus]